MFNVIIFIFGIIGFAYETLFNRTISTMFGSLVYIQGAILFSFILFAGVGALMSDKLRKYLIHIMALLAIFSIIMYCFWHFSVFDFISFVPSVSSRVLITFLITAPGALLIGTIIPILTDLKILNSNQERKGSFLITYLLYHLGAGLIIVLLDLLLIPFFGISNCLALLCVIIIVSIIILSYKKYPLKRQFKYETLNFDFKIIFIIGFISGILQLGVLKTHFHFFGPFSENFTFVIATTIISLGLSSYIVKKGFINKKQWLMLLAPFLVFYVFYLWGGIYFIALVNEYFQPQAGFFDKLSRFVLIFLLYFPIYTAFGCLLPIMHNSNSFNTKNALATNSFANALGILLAMVGVYQFIPLKWVFILSISLLLCFQYSWFKKNKLNQLLISLSLFFLIVWIILFKNIIFHYSFRFFESFKGLSKTVSMSNSYTSYRKGGSEVTFIHANYGDIIIIDGYQTMTINKTVHSKVNEKWLTHSNTENKFEYFVGAMQAFLSKGHDRSFVVGLGTGLTVSANSLFYKRIDAVEINQAILSIQHIFNKYNYGLQSRNNVFNHFDDGFNYLLNSEAKYDLILSNVPTPQYSVASKIWTYDFFKLAKEKLNKGGVFSLWLNGGINPKSIKIILKSLNEVFSNCYVGVIHTMYSNVMCSPDFIQVKVPSYIDKDENISNYLDTYTLDDIYYLIFPIESFKNIDDTTPLNTLNRPTLPYYLDHLMAKSWDTNGPWFIFNYINVNLNNLTEDGLAKRCKIMSRGPFATEEKLPEFCSSLFIGP